MSSSGIPFTMMTPGQREFRAFGAPGTARSASPTWQGSTVTWIGIDATYQFNEEGITCYVVGLLAVNK
nr:hypothetical protein [uncultured Oscillibacter sp.]